MPLNYSFNIPRPAERLLSGLQIGQGIRNIALQREQAQATQVRQDAVNTAMADLNAIERPTASDYTRVASMLPKEQAESVRANWELLSKEQQSNKLRFSGQVLAAFDADPAIAIRIMEERAVADRNAGDEEGALANERWAEIAKSNPGIVKRTMGVMVSTLPGGKEMIESVGKIGVEARAEGLQPGVLKKQAADLGLTEAQTNKAIVDAKKSEAEIKKTNLESAKVATESAIASMKLKSTKPEDIKLSTVAEKLINDSVDTATNLRSLSGQYESLAKAIDSDLASGVAAKIEESTKKLFGSEDLLTRTRQEYRRLRNTQVMNMLPPGVASDKDIQIAMEAFPEDTASPETLSSFLRGMSKLQIYDAKSNDLKAEWVNNVGSLGKARNDVSVGGKTYPRGTNFSDVIEDLITVPSLVDVPLLEDQPAPRVNDTRAKADAILGAL